MSSFRKRRIKCKFTRSCSLYSNSSYTCTHVGGSYCGKYRSLARIAEGKFAMEINGNLTEDRLIQ
ncbi:MAG: hypothetical protein ABR909_12720 [Candidatus Bathyarchaeia archaeon]